MRTLISCVGSSNYKQCNYKMSDGAEVSSRIFSAALIHNSRQQKNSVENVILIGTTDSGWNTTLVELLKDTLLRVPEAMDQEERISQAIQMNAVTQDALDESAEIISKELRLNVRLVLVPRAIDISEQEEFVDKILSALEGTSILHVDVTHGYRHWPILLSQVAFLFKQTNHIKVERISYGFLENNSAVDAGTEVVLDTYLGVGERTAAAAFFRETWDSRVLRTLLPKDQRLNIFLSYLDKFTFMLSMNNIGQARGAAHQILSFFKKDGETCQKILFPFYELIKTTLESVSVGGNSSWEQDRTFFEGLLKRGDYYRAIMFLWEAWLTHALRYAFNRLFPNQPALLNEAIYNLKVRQCMTVWAVHKREFNSDESTRRPIKTINQLRNFVAHGGVIREDMSENLKKTMTSSNDLLLELKQIERVLMNDKFEFRLELISPELRQVLIDEGFRF